MSLDPCWRYVCTSVVGSSHLGLGTPCQDASRVVEEQTPDGTSVLILMACDGAGSAARSEVGARVAQETFWTDACRYLRETADAVTSITADTVRGFVANIRERLSWEAAAEDRAIRDFATTFLAAVVDPKGAFFVQVGDGVIIRNEGEGHVAVTWPENGPYANTTYFVTDEDVLDHLQFIAHTGCLEELALLTDGLQSLALHMATKAVHAPFFVPLFATLRTEPPGLATRLTSPLEAWLCSAPILKRTDDDKTLVLATRRIIQTQ